MRLIPTKSDEKVATSTHFVQFNMHGTAAGHLKNFLRFSVENSSTPVENWNEIDFDHLEIYNNKE